MLIPNNLNLLSIFNVVGFNMMIRNTISGENSKERKQSCYQPAQVWYALLWGRRRGTRGVQRPGPELPAAAVWKHLPSGASVNSPHYPENHCLGQNHLNHLKEERATFETLTPWSQLHFKHFMYPFFLNLFFFFTSPVGQKADSVGFLSLMDAWVTGCPTLFHRLYTLMIWKFSGN